jgi:hypothetical protein
MKERILPILNKFKDPLIVLVVTTLLAYTVYQLSLIVVVSPSREQVEAERASAAASVTKFDTATIEAIIRQTPVPVDVTPRDVGKNDPFF